MTSCTVQAYTRIRSYLSVEFCLTFLIKNGSALILLFERCKKKLFRALSLISVCGKTKKEKKMSEKPIYHMKRIQLSSRCFTSFCLVETSWWKQAIRKAQTLLHSTGHRQSLCVCSTKKKPFRKRKTIFPISWFSRVLYKLIVGKASSSCRYVPHVACCGSKASLYHLNNWY